MGHGQPGTDGFYVDLLGHMDTVGGSFGGALGVGDRVKQATPDVVGDLGYDSFLLNAATIRAVRWRKSFRSCCERSSRWFVAYAVRTNSGMPALS